MTDLRSAQNGRVDEDDVMKGVMDAAGFGGWMSFHVGRSDLGLVQGTSGFPDVVLVHPGRRRLLVLELKREDGRYRPGQAEWLEAFRRAGVDARTIRPGDLEALEDELLGDRLVRVVR